MFVMLVRIICSTTSISALALLYFKVVIVVSSFGLGDLAKMVCYLKKSLMFWNGKKPRRLVLLVKVMGLAVVVVSGHTSEGKEEEGLPTYFWFWPCLPVFSQNFKK